MRKVTALLLAALIISSTLIACSDTPASQGEDTTATPQNVEATSAEETTADPNDRSAVTDGLADTDYEGREFRVAQNTNVGYEFFAEELTGEATNDAVYNRNTLIEDRFNIDIVTTDFTSGGETVSQTTNTVLAGENAWDIVSHLAYMSYTPISKGVYQNWLDVENVNFSQPWWNNIANEASTFNGVMFTATGDINITSLLYTYGMFFNINLAESYGYTATDLYNKVYDGTWTIDNMIAMTKDIYVDNNGDGLKDSGDLFGYAAYPGISSDAWLAAFDQPISGKDADGWPTPAFMTEKTVNALTKIYDFYYNASGSYATMTDAEGEVPMFRDGLVLFVPSIFNDAFTTYRFMDDEYGILPYPKWDEAQEKYLTNARDQYTILGVPVTNNDTAFTGMIIEALCCESYKSVYPAYYDIALKGKYSADRDTANIIDIIMSGRNYDFSYLFGESNFSRLCYKFRDLLKAQNIDITSEYNKIQKGLVKGVEKIKAFYGA